MFSGIEILDIAIRLEENGEKRYRDTTQLTGNLVLINLLESMAEEEKKHARFFSDLKKKIEIREDNHIIQEMSNALVKDIVGDQIFSLAETDFGKIETVGELIRIFIGFENDTILFYEMLKSFITNDAVAGKLNEIISEEKKHIESFRKLAPSEKDSRYPVFGTAC